MMIKEIFLNLTTLLLFYPFDIHTGIKINRKIILSVIQDMNYKKCLTLRKNSYHTLDA